MANVITVNALNKYVRSVLESDAVLTDVAVRGEISGFVHHQKSGHLYFYLKDEQSSVKAVMFRSSAQRLGFEPENGMRVVARCRASLYERDGAFQLYVDALFPDGVGAAQLAFEQLKKKLYAEGLFDETRKRPLPLYPKQVGLITSKHGAALQDILQISARRYPLVTYRLFPVSVQGVNAEREICGALELLGSMEDLDAIIVARGGGSKEDLWVFNSEAIARAAAKCRAPVISAVGHEIDFTILDFIADVRVPTPSAAAEVLLPDRGELMGSLAAGSESARRTLQDRLLRAHRLLRVSGSDLAWKTMKHRLFDAKKTLTGDRRLAQSQQARRLELFSVRLGAHTALAENLDPEKLFRRGFAAVFKEEKQVLSATDLQVGDPIQIQMAGGTLACTVEKIRER